MSAILTGDEQDETVLSVRLTNAKQMVGDLVEMLERSHSEAKSTDRERLAWSIEHCLTTARYLQISVKDVQERA